MKSLKSIMYSLSKFMAKAEEIFGNMNGLYSKILSNLQQITFIEYL